MSKVGLIVPVKFIGHGGKLIGLRIHDGPHELAQIIMMVGEILVARKRLELLERRLIVRRLRLQQGQS